MTLTVRDLDVTCDVSRRVLGMNVVTFGSGRRARSGALGPIESLDPRDPDGNLLEDARQRSVADDGLEPPAGS